MAFGAGLSPRLSVCCASTSPLLREWQGEHPAVPTLQISCETKKVKDLCKPSQSHSSKAMGWIQSTEKIPRDFLGMGLDLGKVSVIQLGSAKLKYPLKASDKAGESE